MRTFKHRVNLKICATLIPPLIGLSACDFVSYSGGTPVTIEGSSHFVSYATNRENVWLAYEKQTFPVVLANNEVYRRNVMAIEAVSGCKVDPYTIDNKYSTTTAFVVCE